MHNFITLLRIYTVLERYQVQSKVPAHTNNHSKSLKS